MKTFIDNYPLQSILMRIDILQIITNYIQIIRLPLFISHSGIMYHFARTFKAAQDTIDSNSKISTSTDYLPLVDAASS